MTEKELKVKMASLSQKMVDMKKESDLAISSGSEVVVTRNEEFVVAKDYQKAMDALLEEKAYYDKVSAQYTNGEIEEIMPYRTALEIVELEDDIDIPTINPDYDIKHNKPKPFYVDEDEVRITPEVIVEQKEEAVIEEQQEVTSEVFIKEEVVAVTTIPLLKEYINDYSNGFPQYVAKLLDPKPVEFAKVGTR